MAGDIRAKYAASGALTITLVGLANDGARESTKVDNSLALELDYLLSVKLVAGVVTGDKKALVYAYGSSDDGTSFTDRCTGIDADVVITSPTNLKYLGDIEMPAASIIYRATFGLARAFDGVLPKYFGIVVVNKSGVAFAAGSTADVQGMKLAYT